MNKYWKGLLDIAISTTLDCMIFLLPFQDVIMMSMPTVSYFFLSFDLNDFEPGLIDTFHH